MEYLIFFCCGMVGLLAAALALAKDLQTDARIANLHFTFGEYVEREGLGLAISFVAVLGWMLVFPEAARAQPKIVGWLRLSFIVVGGTGTWAFQMLFGTTKKWIRAIVDRKTDIADGKIKPE